MAGGSDRGPARLATAIQLWAIFTGHLGLQTWCWKEMAAFGDM